MGLPGGHSTVLSISAYGLRAKQRRESAREDDDTKIEWKKIELTL